MLTLCFLLFLLLNVFALFRGMYVCRTLSFKGVEFEVIEAPLEEKMKVYCHIFCCIKFCARYVGLYFSFLLGVVIIIQILNYKCLSWVMFLLRDEATTA